MNCSTKSIFPYFFNPKEMEASPVKRKQSTIDEDQLYKGINIESCKGS